MLFFVLAVFGLFFANAAVSAEEVKKYHMCRNTRCTISELFINPCAEALYDKPCEVPQNQNASITFKYIPKFGSQKPLTRLYASTAIVDLPFKDMDTNACLYTECPIVADEEQYWEYNLFIAENYPKGRHNVKLKFWDNDKGAKKNSECCFTFNIKIV